MHEPLNFKTKHVCQLKHTIQTKQHTNPKTMYAHFLLYANYTPNMDYYHFYFTSFAYLNLNHVIVINTILMQGFKMFELYHDQDIFLESGVHMLIDS